MFEPAPFWVSHYFGQLVIALYLLAFVLFARKP